MHKKPTRHKRCLCILPGVFAPSMLGRPPEESASEQNDACQYQPSVNAGGDEAGTEHADRRDHREIVRAGNRQWMRPHRFALRMHAVPIQLSATIQITVRTGTGASRPVITAIQGIHHASRLVCGLCSQSCECWTIVFAMMAIRDSRKWRPSHLNAQPGSAGMEPSHTNRIRNNRPASAAASRRSQCTDRKTDRHRSAWFPISRWCNADT